jgi:hypothetical protein
MIVLVHMPPPPDYNPMLAIHGLNPRPALAYDLFLVSDTRVLSIFHLRFPAVLCVRFHAPVVIRMGYTCMIYETKFKGT